MGAEIGRAAWILLNKMAGPAIAYFIRTRVAPTEAQIERELAAKYGRIAESMAGQEVEVVKVEAEPISVNYCLECLQRHYEKAHGLLEEAERFSLGERKLTPEATQKVRKAVEELVTSEDDLDSTGAPPEVRAKLDEIKVKMRDVRKDAWRDRLSFEGAPLDALGKAKAGVDDLLRRTYDLMAEETKREEGMAETAPPPVETPETRAEAPPARGYEAERDVLGHLGEFERTGDIVHLERANEAAKRTKCIACRKYLKVALLATKEGKMGEARGWVSGVKRGIQATLP